MEKNSIPMPTPEDATEATEEQRDLQEKLNHRGEDPQGPAGHQTHHDIPDET